MFQFLMTSILLGIGLAMDACAVSMANGFAEPQMKTWKIFLIAFMFGLFQGVMPLIGYFIGASFINLIDKYIPWIALLLLGFLGGKMLFEAIKSSTEKLKSPDLNLTTTPATATNGSSVNVIEQKVPVAQNLESEIVIEGLANIDSADSSSKTNLDSQNQKNANSSQNSQISGKKITFWLIFCQTIATSIDALSVGLTIADYTLSRAFICAGIVALVTFAISFGSVFLGKKFGTKLGNKAEILGGIILICIGIEIFLTGII